MPIDILMPALSPTMEEGNAAKWLKAEGDRSSAGDVIAEIETDKATMEVEAVDEGTIGKILVPGGTDAVKVNALIAVLLEEARKRRDIGDAAAVRRPQPKRRPKRRPSRRGARVPRRRRQRRGRRSAIPAGTEMVPTTVREALRDAMAEEMRRDGRLRHGRGSRRIPGRLQDHTGLAGEFGAKRVIDTPITEHGFAGLGVGAAMAGLRPIVEFMTFNFAMQAIDQIINSAAKTLYMSGGQMGAPIVFRGPNGAAARVGAQHSQDYAAWYSHVPGLKVIQPYSAADAKGLLKAAIRDPNPVIFLENEILYGQTFDVPEARRFRAADRQGQDRHAKAPDATIGLVRHRHDLCRQGGRRIGRHGYLGRVINLRTIRPLDIDTVIASVQKTGRW
jgi:pyruvate dehydrogenase E1 component beta subunit